MAAGISLPPRQVQQHMPPNSAIAKGLQRMDEKDQDTVEKLHEISFNIALQGLPFTTLRSQVENGKLHRVNLKDRMKMKLLVRLFYLGYQSICLRKPLRKN